MSGLNLATIADALWDLQLAFASINRELDSRREPLDDEVVVNLIDGYAFVDQLLTDRIDLFALGNSSYWLKINAVALCGRTAASAESNRRMLQAAESRFYDDALGGFRDIRSCPVAWCSFSGVITALAGLSRVGQAATAGNPTTGSSLKVAMVSSVM